MLATANPSEEFLVRLRYWLVSGGMMTRMAWGTTTRCSVRRGRSPSEKAASVCPCETARMPARTISAMKDAV